LSVKMMVPTPAGKCRERPFACPQVSCPDGFQGIRASSTLYINTAPILCWFTVLIALVTVVLTRIVIVTALSYGLSQYALEMVIRVLVIELIPLTAALFVACAAPSQTAPPWWRCAASATSTGCAGSGWTRCGGGAAAHAGRRVFHHHAGGAQLRGGAILAYLASTASPGGRAGLHPHHGRVFEPMFMLIFVMKTLFFALAVSMIPMASGLNNIEDDGSRESARRCRAWCACSACC
jgi:phospholipid/cholesterol/gamma-HCH transport system permease protein